MIEALSDEGRRFYPSREFASSAHVRDSSLHEEGRHDHETYWARHAHELLDWSSPWQEICEWNLPFAKWFVGGTLNVSYNCLDRHVIAGRGDRVAFYWEGEPGDVRIVTYLELLDETQRLANALLSLGVRKGDRVNIYLPMILRQQ